MSKRLTLSLGLVALFLAAGSLALYRAATGSLALLDGEVRLAGLSGPVTIERDRYGVPTIRGSSRHDWQPDFRLDPPVAGSNAWAVGAHRTANGRAMVANDMHLGLNVPNTWYRARLVVAGESPQRSPALDATGVTLPGTPLIVAGSNGSIAWGFTNSRGDWSDLVLVETDPSNPGAYLTPDGFVPFEEFEETIDIRGGEPEGVSFRWTRWGPVVGTDHRGRLQALRWLAHMPEAVDLSIAELETTTSVAEAMTLAPAVGIPPQNFVVADAQGSVAWTIMGRIPRRNGYDSSRPASWADGRAGWHGWLAADEYPRVVDPESGLIWTANNRIVREFRRHVIEGVLRGLLAGCGDFDGPVELAATNQVEGPIWQLITQQPDHLLPPPHGSWNMLLSSAADAAVATCGTGPLAGCTWGDANRVDIRHPLAGVLGLLRPWLTIRGGDHVPRIQLPDYGASERFAVAPGDEINGYFHMPGGQSGHPLSPFFAAGHGAWAQGEPLPFLPGPRLHRLTLVPQ